MSKSIADSHASILLAEILKYLTDNNIDYCIERNYGGYPEKLTGDVDLIVAEGTISHVIDLMIIKSSELGWHCYHKYAWGKTAFVGLSKNLFPDRYTLTFELFAGARWHGVTFLESKFILSQKEKIDDIYKPNKAHEAIITCIHHLLYNSKVPEKYRTDIYKNAISDVGKFQMDLGRAIGTTHAAKVSKLIVSENWSGLESIANTTKVKLILYSVIRQPIATFRSIIAGIFANLRRAPGIVIILNSESKGHDQLAQISHRLIEIATKWHIFSPPFRKVFNLDTLTMKDISEISKITKRGGVSILHSNSQYCQKDLLSKLPDDIMCQIDLDNQTLVLNSIYRNLKKSMSYSVPEFEHDLGHLIWNSILDNLRITNE